MSGRLMWLTGAFASLWVLAATGCVHREFEYPAEQEEPDEPRSYTVGLEMRYFDTDMGLHTTVDYLSGARADGEAPASRHIVRIYNSANAEVASATVSDSPEGITAPRDFTFNLAPGSYTAICWSDFTPSAPDDCHYDTSAYPTVTLRCDKDEAGFSFHRGDTPWRDAFCGRCRFRVNGDGAATVEMRRPLAAFRFEATDFEEFSARHGISAASASADVPALLQGYKVIFRYDEYMVSSFSALTDAPVDARVGAAFSASPRPASDGSGNIVLGSDFEFVHPQETSVRVAVEILNPGGERIARAGPFAVPLLRNKLTIVRGHFLTAKSGAGVVIDVSFEGDFNIKV